MTDLGIHPQARSMAGRPGPIEGRTNEWYTPPAIFDAIGLEYDLDPCAPPLPAADWIPAERRISLPEDGLTAPWKGRVWLNPPYGPHTGPWLRRLAAHGDGIGLVFARTDTAWFHDTAAAATAVCFIAGRLTFVPEPTRTPVERTNFNSGAPSMLLAYGDECAEAIVSAGLGMTFAIAEPTLAGQGSLWEAST